MNNADPNLQQLHAHLEPIRHLLEDQTIHEIVINGPDHVFVERAGKLEQVSVRFTHNRAIHALIQAVSQFLGRRVSTEKPLLEGQLPDGSRLTAVLPPAAADGPILAIRRFPSHNLSLQARVTQGSLDADTAALLLHLIQQRRNILICGGSGAGKTSLLNLLANLIPHTERVMVLEDVRELSLGLPHALRLLTRPADIRGRGRVTLNDLLRSALRMRPDRIVLGELRGSEALDLVQAMTGGHGGCLTSIHGGHPQDALAHLESLMRTGGASLPSQALRQQIVSAVDYLVHTSRCGDGRCRITQVASLDDYEPSGGYRLLPPPPTSSWTAES